MIGGAAWLIHCSNLAPFRKFLVKSKFFLEGQLDDLPSIGQAQHYAKNGG